MNDEFFEVRECMHIGRWGMDHREYLKENYPLTLSEMVKEGQLCKYLAALDQKADNRYRSLIKKMSEMEGLSKDIKFNSPVQWRKNMKKVTQAAEAVVKQEFVFISPDKIILNNTNKT